MLSREAAFLANNLLFVAAMFAVLWGTLFPLISEGFSGQKITVGPPFFDRVNIPLGLMLLALMGIGPVIAWRKATPRNLRRNFFAPVAVGAGDGWRCWWRGAAHVRDPHLRAGRLHAGDGGDRVPQGNPRARRHRARGALPALFHLVERNRRRYGGYIVHAGLVIGFMGFAGQAYNVEETVVLRPGESTVVSPFGHTYPLSYQDMSWYTARNMTELIASMRQNGTVAGGVMTAEQPSTRSVRSSRPRSGSAAPGTRTCT